MKDRFPEGFLWGSSTSAYQVEGGNYNNDWYEWEASGGTSPCGEACDHYRSFKEDFKIAKELGHNAHRLGIEWSRLEKEEGIWDESEWGHYKSVLDELTRLKITPIVTLNHFTIPLWLSHKGGWLSDESPGHFTRFAAKAVKELGNFTEYWITFNEPNILAILEYFYGRWTPCRKNFAEALIVLKNMLKAHAMAYSLMKKEAESTPGVKKPKITIAKAVTAFHPCSRYSPLDRLVTYWRSCFHNHAFIASSIKGEVRLPGLAREKLSAKKTIDFLGLNYYSRQFIHYEKPLSKNPLGVICSLDHHAHAGKMTDMNWEIYPEGIYEVVKSFARWRLPIMITENGLATTSDALRKDYIKRHLLELLRAINEGLPVIGYLHWSLLDNFEWSDGYSKRFGLVRVDYPTQKRTITDAARYYAQVIESGKP